MTIRIVHRSDRDVNSYGRLAPVLVTRPAPKRTYQVARPTCWKAPSAELAKATFAKLDANASRSNNRQRLYCASFMTRDQLAQLAMTFGGGKTPLSQTALLFGPFAGLTLQQVVDLKAGQVVARLMTPAHIHKTLVLPSWTDYQDRMADQAQRSRWGLPHWQHAFNEKGQLVVPVEVSSDTEGIRYLDRLLDVETNHWLFPNTYARVVLFLTHHKVRLTRTLAYSWGQPYDQLDTTTYGDAIDVTSKHPRFDQVQKPDLWHAQARERLSRRSAFGVVDTDPTPDGWDLTDPSRLDNRKKGEDPWEDHRVTPFNDLEWDWQPPAVETPRTVKRLFKVVKVVATYRHRDPEPGIGLDRTAEASAEKLVTVESPQDEKVSRRVWARGLQVIADLARVGGPTERPLADYQRRLADWEALAEDNLTDDERPCEWGDRLKKVLTDARRDLLVDGRWHPDLPADVRSELTRTIAEAKERLRVAYDDANAAALAKKAAEEDEATRKFLAAIGSLALVLVNREKYHNRRWNVPKIERAEPTEPTNKGRGRFQHRRVKYTYTWEYLDFEGGYGEFAVEVLGPGGICIRRQEPASVEVILGWIKDELSELAIA